MDNKRGAGNGLDLLGRNLSAVLRLEIWLAANECRLRRRKILAELCGHAAVPEFSGKLMKDKSRKDYGRKFRGGIAAVECSPIGRIGGENFCWNFLWQSCLTLLFPVELIREGLTL